MARLQHECVDADAFGVPFAVTLGGAVVLAFVLLVVVPDRGMRTLHVRV